MVRIIKRLLTVTGALVKHWVCYFRVAMKIRSVQRFDGKNEPNLSRHLIKVVIDHQRNWDTYLNKMEDIHK